MQPDCVRFGKGKVILNLSSLVSVLDLKLLVTKMLSVFCVEVNVLKMF